jgi:hypothetical protein
MKGILALFAVLSLVMVSCEVTVHDGMIDQSAGSGTGDGGISNVTFSVDTTYMLASPGMLVARGLAKNSGSETISSPWYVECQFYTDSTLLIKLGVNDTQIGVPLSPGQSVYWTISFSSGNVDVRRFPDFRVSDMRALYKN